MVVHLLSKYLLSIYYVPVAVLGPISIQRVRLKKTLPSGSWWPNGKRYESWKERGYMSKIIFDNNKFWKDHETSPCVESA